ncbi:MAG TPA: hypothetical protein VME01_08895 [Solirubrobacteraceae bacterium]|nr:hypothetical protein [Solirubrobacteraceae bacterium]
MFRPAITRLTQRVADTIDDMLVGDFDYILDGGNVYADVDYYREHPHRVVTQVPVTRRPSCVGSAGGPCTAAGRSVASR